MLKSKKIYYAAGPGNVVGTFHHWIKGQEDPSQFAQTYSSQFFSLVKNSGFEGLAVSTHNDKCEIEQMGVTAKNRPLVFDPPKNTIQFVLRQALAAIRIWTDILQFQPRFAVISEGTTFWFLLLPLRLLGVQFIPSIHCVVHLPGEQSNLRRISESIEDFALKKLATHCLTASAEISEQISVRTSHAFLPTYFRSRFKTISAARFSSTTFNLLFIGRIESDKGVFDLLEAFQHASRNSQTTFKLDYCGTGNDVRLLESTIKRKQLNRVVSVNGHCSFDKLQEKLSTSHIVVVPTTSRFVEGFNQVIVEGVLSGRPVIATDVCPSANLFRYGVTTIPADSVSALSNAITKLSSGETSYNAALESIEIDQSRFFQLENSWHQQLRNCIQQLSSEKDTDPHRQKYKEATPL